MTRYSVKECKLDDDHPLWPKEIVFAVADSMYATEDNPDGYISSTVYLTKLAADKVVEDLNRGIGWIT